MFRFALFALSAPLFCGCLVLPELAYQPVIHNPFPQLSKVAVAPFFNLSTEPTVDGRKFAMAYYEQLQSVPGFEVFPVGVVETAMQTYNISLKGPEDARKLAQILGADALVIGAVTDYSPYYPPRCGIQVEWYAANPCFHPIPPGYGLPWGTADEEQIPAPLIFEAEMALARAQLKTQTPDFEPQRPEPPPTTPVDEPQQQAPESTDGTAAPAAYHESLPDHADPHLPQGPLFPPDWPDPQGFIPPGPRPVKAPCDETYEPVLRHTRIYSGHDADFTEALASYEFFRDDARFGGWQAYLQRSDDFIRFCCHMHIAEMLSARGGADETRVVWRWPTDR